MSNNLRKNIYSLKHILSQEWIPATLIKEDDTDLTFLVSNHDAFFEENDKILYSTQRSKNKIVQNSVVTDIDFINDDRVSITITKPIERRKDERFIINIPAEIVSLEKNFSTIVTDISRKGFKFKSLETLSLKEEFKIAINVANNVNITCKCLVVYKNPSVELSEYLYGCKISSISYENNLLLNDFIETLK